MAAAILPLSAQKGKEIKKGVSPPAAAPSTERVRELLQALDYQGADVDRIANLVLTRWREWDLNSIAALDRPRRLEQMARLLRAKVRVVRSGHSDLSEVLTDELMSCVGACHLAYVYGTLLGFELRPTEVLPAESTNGANHFVNLIVWPGGFRLLDLNYIRGSSAATQILSGPTNGDGFALTNVFSLEGGGRSFEARQKGWFEQTDVADSSISRFYRMVQPKDVKGLASARLANAALRLAGEKQFDAALTLIQRGLALDSSQALHYLVHASAVQERDNNAVETRRIYLRGIEANPYSYQLLTYFALYFFRQNNLDEAEKYLAQSESIHSQFYMTFFVQGLVALQRQNFEQAITMFNTAMRLNPEHAPSYDLLKLTYQSRFASQPKN